MKTASISSLKSHLCAELKEVQAGGTLLVLDRDHPIARILPYDGNETSSVREPVKSFEYGHPSPLISSGALDPLLVDRGRR